MATVCAVASRKLVTVSGPDAFAFLQGLITVDMRKLTDKSLMSGAFLNAKGRILHDIFIAKRTGGDGSIIYDLETNKDSVDDLTTMLTRYRLRRKVVIAPDESRQVYAVWDNEPSKVAESESWFVDPRPGHALGHRVWAKGKPSTSNNAVKQLDETAYHQIRMAIGLSEGLAESADELPFILNYDWWPNTLAFDKGCYTGQELVARTHFKGQVRKRIVPVVLSIPNKSTTDPKLLPSFASWKVLSTTEQIPPLKSALEPIAGTNTSVGDGTLLALAPGGLNLGLAALRDAQSVPLPGSEFKPTHEIKFENGDRIQACLIRPQWWPAVESI